MQQARLSTLDATLSMLCAYYVYSLLDGSGWGSKDPAAGKRTSALASSPTKQRKTLARTKASETDGATYLLDRTVRRRSRGFLRRAAAVPPGW